MSDRSLVSAMAFVRLSAPDLGVMEEFLTEFGLRTAHRDENRLYMHGAGDSPYIHVTEKGPAGTLSQAYLVDDVAALEDLVARGLAQRVEDLDGPGGGKRVRLRDPDNCVVELVAGRGVIAPEPKRPMVRPPDGTSKLVGPARVLRVAHTAVQATDPRVTIKWYQDTLGLVPSDELYIGTRDNLMGQFNRVHRPGTLVDHHIIFILKGKQAGMHHASFEVEAVDDIFFGNNHLAHGGRDHVRGIGRHALGSQIFDYWMSPFDQMHEHWSSAEKMSSDSGMGYVKIGEGMSHDTGDKPPERFTKQASPYLHWAD